MIFPETEKASPEKRKKILLIVQPLTVFRKLQQQQGPTSAIVAKAKSASQGSVVQVQKPGVGTCREH